MPAHSTCTQRNRLSFSNGQKLQQTSCVPHQLAQMLLVSGQSSRGASTRQIPLTEVPHLPGTLTADVRTLTGSFSTDLKLGTWVFSASILAPDLLSEGSTHKPCSSVTKCDLNRAPLPQLLVPSQYCRSRPRPSSGASPTTVATDKMTPSRNAIPCGRVFAARSHDVSYFSSSPSLAVTLAQL